MIFYIWNVFRFFIFHLFILILDLHIRLERSKYPYGCQCFDAMTKSVPPIQYFYYKDDKYFEHFHNVYNLMKDCKSRLEKIQGRQEGTFFMSKEVIIKIGIAGYIDEDNLTLIFKEHVQYNKYIKCFTKQIHVYWIYNIFYCLVFNWMHYL